MKWKHHQNTQIQSNSSTISISPCLLTTDLAPASEESHHDVVYNVWNLFGLFYFLFLGQGGINKKRKFMFILISRGEGASSRKFTKIFHYIFTAERDTSPCLFYF